MEVNDGESQVQDVQADQVNDALGMDQEAPLEAADDQSEGSRSNESLAVQKRLKAQKRSHEREVRALHQRIGEMESRMAQPNMQSQDHDQYSQPPADIDQHIHKAVSYALRAKEDEERKAREAQNQAHVNREYQDFGRHLDSMNDKYEDFHDVVYGDETPYTSVMRDYALTLPRKGNGSAGEVLYKLGKNPEELERISKLHPLKQAAELSKLSHALISGGENKSSQAPRPMGQIKSNPASNSNAAITEKTPVGSIRERMKSGSWK